MCACQAVLQKKKYIERNAGALFAGAESSPSGHDKRKGNCAERLVGLEFSEPCPGGTKMCVA